MAYTLVYRLLTKGKDRQIACAGDARAEMGDALDGLDHEELHAMYLDREHRMLETRLIASGNAGSVEIRAAAVLSRALALEAAAIIIAHNHISGSPVPSAADITETERLKQACDIVGVTLTDHIIVAGPQCFSFAEGMLPNRKRPEEYI